MKNVFLSICHIFCRHLVVWHTCLRISFESCSWVNTVCVRPQSATKNKCTTCKISTISGTIEKWEEISPHFLKKKIKSFVKTKYRQTERQEAGDLAEPGRFKSSGSHSEKKRNNNCVFPTTVNLNQISASFTSLKLPATWIEAEEISGWLLDGSARQVAGRHWSPAPSLHSADVVSFQRHLMSVSSVCLLPQQKNISLSLIWQVALLRLGVCRPARPSHNMHGPERLKKKMVFIRNKSAVSKLPATWVRAD